MGDVSLTYSFGYYSPAFKKKQTAAQVTLIIRRCRNQNVCNTLATLITIPYISHNSVSCYHSPHYTKWKYALQMAQYNTEAMNPTEFRRVLRPVYVLTILTAVKVAF